jgi:hypothetical protein
MTTIGTCSLIQLRLRGAGQRTSDPSLFTNTSWPIIVTATRRRVFDNPMRGLEPGEPDIKSGAMAIGDSGSSRQTRK